MGGRGRSDGGGDPPSKNTPHQEMHQSGPAAGSVVPLFRPVCPKPGNKATNSHKFSMFYVGETVDLIAVAGWRIGCPDEVLDVRGGYMRTGGAL